MRSPSLLLTAALLASPMAAVSAHAATCPDAVDSSVYQGLTCTVGPLEFSNILIVPNPSGTGTISPITVSRFTSIDGNEFGLQLSFNANTGLGGGTTDIDWSYNVRGLTNPINDVFLAFNGDTPRQPSGIELREVLKNINLTLTLTDAGSKLVFITPIQGLDVSKEQFNFAGVGGEAFTSHITNGFSVVPIPGAALLMGSALGFAGFGAWRRRRREGPPALA